MAALRAARASGKRNWEAKEQPDVYDEVDEEVYRSVVRGRLMEDDFIEEDNGVSGYADNGMDEWDRSASEGDDDEEKERLKEKKKAAKEKKEKQLKAAAKKRAKELVEISEGANPYINPTKQAKGLPLQEHEDDFMASLLGDLDGKAQVKKTESPRTAVPTVRRAKPSLVKSAVAGSKRFADMDASAFRSNAASSDFNSDPLSSDPGFTPTTAPSSDGFDGSAKKARFDPAIDQLEDDLGGMDQQFFDDDLPALGAGEASKNNEDVKMEDDDDDDLYVKPTAPAAKPKGPPQRRTLVNASAAKPKPAKAEAADDVLPAEDNKPKRKGLDWRTATTGLLSANGPLTASESLDAAASFNEDHKTVIASTSMRAPAQQQANTLEPDGSLRFWWFDYDEPSPGTVRLVGKVRVHGEMVKVASSVNHAKVEKDVPRYVSATVTVKNIKRKLYVLPKSKAEYYGGEVDEDDSDDEGDELAFDDVEDDFLSDAKGKWNLQNATCTKGYVKRQYAFGVKGVPRKETNWMEVTCDFPVNKRNEVDIPIDASGEQYSHVFGSTATPFERFVIDHKVMGPCWLNLKAPKINKGDAFSWTKLEAEIDVKDISPFASTDANAPKDVPRLTILSLSSRTVVHLKENKREIVCAAARVWEHVDIDDPTPIENQGSSAKIFVRNLFTEFPAGFEQMARQQNSGATIALFKAERPLLVQLL
ncbi:hypothetical protein JCM3770_000705, partial [Rhodotorula araucariae]